MDLDFESLEGIFSRNETMTKKHGGKRPGSGRKKMTEKVVGKAVYLKPSQWKMVDRLRGGLTRSKWFAAKIHIDGKGRNG